ncbi:hypothetical protein SAMN05192545_2914 [Maribacter dokdonensis]|uniref:Uncharacterized protein n=1 Tax=Maribacter dokdonensis TaxID=320912 RepID=A0ABY0UTJ8_9FLAO|nr:hypothetical protein [Maribacter dokdonensis]SDT16343.1 hypothetical protein SAMN05192545_2914 [Maribacter dokdonensis]
MADKAITRRLKIYVNGQEVDATISNLTKNLSKFRALANRSIEGTDEFKKYNAEVARLELELSQARGAQRAFREETKLTEKGITASEKALTDFTGSFQTMLQGYKNGDILQVKEGFNGVKSGISGATKAALAFIATPLGAAIAALVGIGTAAKAWFDYNSQVVEALRLTTQITGLTDAAADNARIRAQTLSEAFDTDFQKNLETANALAKQFGISFDEAFDVIEDQLVRGQANNDEFFQNLNEYPTFFNNAKFSAEEFGRVIATGYDLGIYNDKLPDAVKEAGLAIEEQTTATVDALTNAFGAAFTDDILARVSDGTTSVKDALAEIADESNKQQLNVQQNAQLTADLFKGAGEDAGGAIKIFEALDIALNQNQRELTESEQITQDQINANKELSAVTSAIFSTGDQGFGLLIDKAKLFGTTLLLDILKTGVDVYNWIVDLNNESAVFSTILTTLGVVAQTPFQVIGTLIDNAKNAFGSLADVVEGIFTFDFDKIKEGLQRGLVVSVQTMQQIKAKAEENSKAIEDAFNGKSSLTRKSLDDFISSDAPVTSGASASGVANATSTNNPQRTTNNELTPEDQRIIDSKKKVTEFLKKFDEEQKLEQQLKDLEEAEANKLKQELELEAKYAQLIANAEGEKELIAQLKEAQRIELAKIDEEYNESEAEKNKALQDQLLKQEQEANAKRIAERKRLGQDIINNAISLAGQETRLGQALLAAKGLMAAREMLIELGVLKGKAAVAVAEGTLATSVGAANTAKVGFPQNVPLLLAFAAQAVGIISAIKGATKSADTATSEIPSFEKGGETFSGSYTGGVDGRGGQYSILHPDEYVVPKYLRSDPIVQDLTAYTEAKRTGKTIGVSEGNTTNNQQPTTNNQFLELLAQKFMDKLDEPLKVLFTLNDVVSLHELEEKLENTVNESKGN